MKKSNTRTLSRFLGLFLALALAVLALPLTPDAVAANYAPVAENMQFTTYRNVPLSGSLQAVDPEGDLLTFALASAPGKGEVSIASDGNFTYSPYADKKGKDTFTYTAMDAAGNISTEAEVTIQIEKQATKISYADLTDSPYQYPALRLAEAGIFIGEQVGSQYFFAAATEVTRGEFLTMCMQVAGIEGLDGIARTGFSDDASMPLWLKPYVSAALLSGIVQGYQDKAGELVFGAEDTITYAQAAVILNNALSISDVVSTASVSDASLVPDWALQAAVNLTACDILPAGIGTVSNQAVTRGEAAAMLSAAMDLLAARED